MSDQTQDQGQRITALATSISELVTPTHTFTDVFNALVMSTISFVIDYLVVTGKEVTEATVAEEIQKISAMMVAQADFLINTVDITAKITEELANTKKDA